MKRVRLKDLTTKDPDACTKVMFDAFVDRALHSTEIHYGDVITEEMSPEEVFREVRSLVVDWMIDKVQYWEQSSMDCVLASKIIAMRVSGYNPDE